MTLGYSLPMVGVLVLGLIQGLTEFLPVSSSGHLALGSELFGLHPPSLLLDVMLHVGTLVPVLIFYRDDVVDAFRSLRLLGNPRAHWSESAGLRLTVCVVVGSIPTAIIGVLAAEQISLWLSNLKTVCIAFFVTGGVLLLTLVRRRFVADPETGFRTLTIGKALAIGFAQGLAITPGVSRSGSTIATSLLLNVERQMAARFFIFAFSAGDCRCGCVDRQACRLLRCRSDQVCCRRGGGWDQRVPRAVGCDAFRQAGPHALVCIVHDPLGDGPLPLCDIAADLVSESDERS